MNLGAAIGQNDVLYVSARDDGPSAAVLVAGTVVRGAHHRPGLLSPAGEDGAIDLDALAAWIAGAAALLDTGIVILDAPEAQTDALANAALDRA